MARIRDIDVESEILISIYGKDGLQKLLEKFLTSMEKKFIKQCKDISASIDSIFAEPEQDVPVVSSPGEKSPLDDEEVDDVSKDSNETDTS